MKRNLGRVVLLALLIPFALYAEVWEWKMLNAPTSLYVGQSGVIRYECRFTTNAADYTIAFKPKSTDTYTIEMLTQSDKIVNEKRIQTFDLLITPTREGNIVFAPDALMRHTTFASIENATIGRDNVKKYDFNDEKANLPPVRFVAKTSPVVLNGQMKLEAKVDKTTALAHEPIHLSVSLSGEGNLDRYIPLSFSIKGVNLFAEAPVRNIALSSQGYRGEITQSFALVSRRPYTIPALSLPVLDTISGKVLTLKTDPIRIEIEEGYNPANLLDAPDLRDTAVMKRYALYGMFMLLGALLFWGTHKMWGMRPRRREKAFWEKIKDPKELAIALALHDPQKYREIIQGLDRNELTLRDAKKKLIQKGES